MISNEQLAEWERLCNEAAPGPWCYAYRQRPDGMYSGQVYNDKQNICTMHWVSKEVEPRHLRCIREESGLFIAAAREAVPALIAEVRRTVALWRFTCAELREKTEQLEKEADWLAEQTAINCPTQEFEEKCTHKSLEKDKCRICWREAARRAVQNAS